MSKLSALAVFLVAGGAFAAESKTAEQQFKNIQVLKGVPASQIDPAMDVMAAALGVGCAHCHVQGPPQGPWPMEKDDKQAKRTARKMITMTEKINHDFFGGDMVVTCATCHNGHVEPRSLPPMEKLEKPGAAAEGEGKLPALTTKQILDKWLQASGGAAAWGKIHTRVSKGTLAGFGPEAQPLEVVQSAPDHWKLTVNGARGTIVNAWNGKVGWRSFGMVMPIEGDDALETRRQAQLAPPVTMPKLLEGLKVVADMTLPKGNMHVLEGKQGALHVRLYFDAVTGLLARVLSRQSTPVGDLPHETDFDDYRAVDGVKLPFLVKERRGGHEFTQTYVEIKNNVAVDEAGFAVPPAPPVPTPAK